MAKRKSKGRKAKVSVPAEPEVEAVAVILMNAVVAAIDDFESDTSFLMNMGSIAEDEVDSEGMDGAAKLKKTLSKYLGNHPSDLWGKVEGDDLGHSLELLSRFHERGLLKLPGRTNQPRIDTEWTNSLELFGFGETSEELAALEAVSDRILSGVAIASNFEELEEVATVTGFSVKQDGQEVIVSRNEGRRFSSVQAAASAMLVDEELRRLPRKVEAVPESSLQPNLECAAPPIQRAPLAVQDPVVPTVFHEDGRAFRYEKGYRIYL